MEVGRARQLLKAFERAFKHGGEVDAATIRELYLAGYIEIDLQSSKKELHMTTITAKGKQLLET